MPSPRPTARGDAAGRPCGDPLDPVAEALRNLGSPCLWAVLAARLKACISPLPGTRARLQARPGNYHATWVHQPGWKKFSSERGGLGMESLGGLVSHRLWAQGPTSQEDVRV